MTPERDITPGSTNVFRDLGVPDPELHQLKAALVSALGTFIRDGVWTLEAAARRLGMEPAALHDLTFGHIRDVTLDDLARSVFELGGAITVQVSPPDAALNAAALQGALGGAEPQPGERKRPQGGQPENSGRGDQHLPSREPPRSVDSSLTDKTPERVGGELANPFPTGEDLFAQVTNLLPQQVKAALQPGSAVPVPVSTRQIAVNIAARFRLPWRAVLPILGTTADPPVPSREVLLQTYRVLDLFAIVLSVLEAEDAAHWFTKPNRHLDGRSPLELCQTPEGQSQLRDYLDALLSGNFA